MDIDQHIRYLADLDRLGVTIPTPAQRVADTYRTVTAALAASPSDDLRAALAAGELTPDNVGPRVLEAARDLNARQGAQIIVRDLALPLAKAITVALTDASPQIVTDLRAVFDPAAKGVTAAAAHFGPTTTAEEVIGLAPAAVKAWNTLGEHAATLTAVATATSTLYRETVRVLPDHRVTLFVADAGTDLDAADDLYAEESAGQDARWLALAHAGYPLQLNTLAEAEAVAARAIQAEADSIRAGRAGVVPNDGFPRAGRKSYADRLPTSA